MLTYCSPLCCSDPITVSQRVLTLFSPCRERRQRELAPGNPVPRCSAHQSARTFVRHNLLRFFLLSGQQAADKLRPFPSVVFECPFLTTRMFAKYSFCSSSAISFNLPFQFWIDSKSQEFFSSARKYRSAFPPTQSRRQF